MSAEIQKQQIKELLKLHYGFGGFRPGQEQVIDSILSGQDTMVIMPTGGGKSLCYQLPALVMEGVTIVISPLISLMKDQVDSLERIGIPATFINSSISQAETDKRIAAVKGGSYKLLYIAPERFYSREFTEMLKNIKVGLFAIDEAHCISQWGHDFRPSYLRLKYAIAQVGRPPIAALTATATPEVKEDIMRQLEMKDPRVIVTGFARPNLQFGVIQARENEKPRIALEAVQSAPDSSGIIYASTRARVDGILQYLLENNIEAAAYHAGMEAEERKWVQDEFLKNKIKVIVATNAFGLGIDKPDVRFVVHYDMPGTVEAYYQEAGRAGRDGQTSFCLLIFNSRDRALHEFFIKGDNPPAAIIREIYEILLNYNSDSVLLTYSELGGMLSDTLPDMAIGTALKALEQQGLIQRTREKSGQGFLKLVRGFTDIKEKIGARAKKQLQTLEALEKRFKKEAQNGFEFNAEDTGNLLGVGKDALMRLVKKLADAEMAEYRPPFKGTEIRILKRIEPEEIELDQKAIEKKLGHAFKKLDKMEEYAYALDCRQKFILSYFGEDDPGDCGRCDSCLTLKGYGSRNGSVSRFSGGHYPARTVEKELVVREPDEDVGFETKLTQLSTLDLFRSGMGLEKIMEKRNLAREEVLAHFNFLLDNKLLDKERAMEILPKPLRKKIYLAVERCGSDRPEDVAAELGGEVGTEEAKLALRLFG